jgi:peptidoglycan/LPS O-acetylase OafA/YrhL
MNSLSMRDNPEPAYRRDIDGLRAVSIIAVVAYHAFPKLVPGGFVGVDAFFVISGFLISTIIFEGIDGSGFSFAEFYARRVRRIFPALILVLIACLAAGWYFLIAEEYGELGKHVAGGAGFVANIVLWRESGYFDTAAQTKPLLHLWSLGVEEQFYLVWPLLLVAAARLRLPRAILLASILVASFVLEIAAVGHDRVAAFYLPQMRFWELMLGAALAHVLERRGHLALAGHDPAGQSLLPQWHGYLVGRTGLIGPALIIGAAIGLSDDSAFPGWWALLPTLGAVLIVAAGPNAWFNRAVLGHPIMVFIGLISYPLYLWHWPLLTFARIVVSNEPSAGLRVGAVAASVVLAWLTFVLFERPVRRSRRWSVALALVAAMGVSGGVGYDLWVPGGWAARYWANWTMHRDFKSFESYRANYAKCSGSVVPKVQPYFCTVSREGPVDRVLIGDSHADHLFPGLAKVDSAHTWLLVGTTGCPPLWGVDMLRDGEQGQCLAVNESAIEMIEANPQIKMVLLSFFGSLYLREPGTIVPGTNRPDKRSWTFVPADPGKTGLNNSDAFLLGLDNTVTRLEAAGKAVTLFVDIPELSFEPSECFGRGFARPKRPNCDIPRAEVNMRQAQLRLLIGRLVALHPAMRIFDPVDLLCDQTVCRMAMYYRDANHLSLDGSQRMAVSFLQWLGGKMPSALGGAEPNGAAPDPSLLH